MSDRGEPRCSAMLATVEVLSVAEAAAATTVAGQDEGGRVEVRGQICSVRKLSKRLLFLDLRQLPDRDTARAAGAAAAGAHPAAPAGCRLPQRPDPAAPPLAKISCVVKEAAVGSSEAVAALRRAVKLGDAVRIAGQLERE
eukprot:SAG22_NODE_6268_length_877_cov_1.128535_1_plen_140_part_10